MRGVTVEREVAGEVVERPAPLPEPEVLGVTVERQPPAAAPAAQAQAAEVSRPQLPVTGPSTTLLFVAGISLLLGAGLLGLRERLAARVT